MASSGGPEEEFGDNVRKNLLSDLEQRVGLAVPPETWACLWLADIERLKAWIEQSREEKISNLTRNVLYSFERDHKLLAQCMIKALLYSYDEYTLRICRGTEGPRSCGICCHNSGSWYTPATFTTNVGDFITPIFSYLGLPETETANVGYECSQVSLSKSYKLCKFLRS